MKSVNICSNIWVIKSQLNIIFVHLKKKLFSGSCTLKGQWWCTVDFGRPIFMNKYDTFFKFFCIKYHLWNDFCKRNFSLRLLFSREKKVVELTFDESHKTSKNKYDTFFRNFVFILIMKILLKEKFLSASSILRRKKWFTIDLWWLIYILCLNKYDTFSIH